MTYREDMMLGPVIVDVTGLSLLPEDEVLLREPWVGGIILFTRNYRDVAQLCELVAQIRAVRPELLVCVDQEGGRVQRFRDGFTIIPPMADIGAVYRRDAQHGAALARACGWLMAAELRSCLEDAGRREKTWAQTEALKAILRQPANGTVADWLVRRGGF